MSPAERLSRLYGHPNTSLKTIEVYTDGSCHENGTEKARAGSGIYWGPNSPKFLAIRVPGSQTNDRGEVYAVLQALLMAPSQPILKIFSDSVYTIKSRPQITRHVVGMLLTEIFWLIAQD
jgi:ribonuclease HI